ncbi:hypothetical protein LY78DRAFT_661985 [Colletotrichum sublineola]|nr:hypothetical protein LY78DRAFT_661985 [Colletotrichum sublineola]
MACERKKNVDASCVISAKAHRPGSCLRRLPRVPRHRVPVPRSTFPSRPPTACDNPLGPTTNLTRDVAERTKEFERRRRSRPCSVYRQRYTPQSWISSTPSTALASLWRAATFSHTIGATPGCSTVPFQALAIWAGRTKSKPPRTRAATL